MSHVCTVSARVIAILESCQQKLNGVCMKQPDLSDYRDEILISEGCEEINDILNHQTELKNRECALERILLETKCLGNKKQYTIAQDEKNHISNKLREYSKILNRRLKEYPSVISNNDRTRTEFRALINDINSLIFSVEDFVDESADFRWDTLTSQSSQKNRDKLVKIESDLVAKVKKIQNEWKTENELNEKYRNKLQAEIDSISNQINHIQKGTDSAECEYREKVKARTCRILNAIKAEEDSISNKSTLVRKFIRLENEAHDINVQQLKNEISDLEKQCNANGKYQDDILYRMKKEYDDMKIEREKNLSVLLDFRSQWDEEKRLEEERFKKLKEMETEKQYHLINLKKKNDAAYLIQRAFKFYRKNFKTKPKAKKGSKKKKKSKKK